MDEVERTKRMALHIAAIKGDWSSVTNDPELSAKLADPITDNKETALHIAAAHKQESFVSEMLNYFRDPHGLKDLLEVENSSGNTALCYAAFAGKRKTAMLMVEKYNGAFLSVNDRTITIQAMLPNLGTIKPLVAASSIGQHEMVQYLLGANIHDTQTWSLEDRNQLFINIIDMNLFGQALTMLQNCIDLAIADRHLHRNRDRDMDNALLVLARTPSAFAKEKPSFWSRCKTFRRRVNGIYATEPDQPVITLVKGLCEASFQMKGSFEAGQKPEGLIAQAVLAAAEVGNTEFVIHLLRNDPGLIWKVHPHDGSIFHIAVRNRYADIFTLLHEFDAMKDLIASNNVRGENNMLHLAAELAPESQLNAVSGAALQMQRELFWFKEVEKVVRPSQKDGENSKKKTPRVLFDQKHKSLRLAGERWMKDTAQSCMLVATLIATVMFAAIFTVPGGYKNDTETASDAGMPVLENQDWFWVFSTSVAIALCSSSTSILMFVSIQTSRYEDDDFLNSLPCKLMIGVTTLFFSLVSMMVAFCATFLLYYPHHFPWILVVLAVFTLLPLAYVSAKYPLLADLIHTAHRSRQMFRFPKRLFT